MIQCGTAWKAWTILGLLKLCSAYGTEYDGQSTEDLKGNRNHRKHSTETITSETNLETDKSFECFARASATSHSTKCHEAYQQAYPHTPYANIPKDNPFKRADAVYTNAILRLTTGSKNQLCNGNMVETVLYLRS